MSFINIEIKAKCFHPERVEAFLLSANARSEGTDFQRDTYFHVPNGRLKLRQGNIEKNLIFYKRNDQKGPKQSDFQLVKIEDGALLEALLANALGIKVIVQKRRKIYYLDNIKIHIDEVPELGNFVEIEASNKNHPHLSNEKLRQQCESLMKAFDIRESDLIENSYSDMMLRAKS